MERLQPTIKTIKNRSAPPHSFMTIEASRSVDSIVYQATILNKNQENINIQ